jgi:glucose/arabinose dehydrogenase
MMGKLATYGVLLIAGAFLVPAAWAASDRGCADNNGGVSVPKGFCAEVFAKDVGGLRHLAVSRDGTVYAALSRPRKGGGIAILQPGKKGHHAKSVHYFGDVHGTGIAVHGGWLYFAETTRIVRFKLSDSGMPTGKPQTVVAGMPEQHEHNARGIAFDDAGHLYVNIGAPSNACQKRDRHRGSKGIKHCPLLEKHGGIWRFAADKTGQHFSARNRYATGLRNTIALAWNKHADALYGTMMGRDQLHDNWPKKFTAKQSAELPAEEMLKIVQGGNYGWPYCYYDGQQKKLVLAPEYGGNGKKVGRCDQYKTPLVAFPAHWAPEAMVFYTARAFPKKYRGGAFVAFHGSWNRAPLPQKGFNVAFVPFAHGKSSGDYQVFAEDFAGSKKVSSPGQAKHRPVGVAVGPKGALYVADSQNGWIWRIAPE